MKQLFIVIFAAIAGVVIGALSSGSRPGVGETNKSADRANDSSRPELNGASDPREVALGTALMVLREKRNDLRGLTEFGAAIERLDSAQIAKMMDYPDRTCAGKFDGRMRWLIKWWPKRDAAAAWIRPLLDAAAHDGARRDMGMNDSDILADEWADADPKAASGDFAKAFAIRIPVAGEIGNPDLIAHARLAVGSAHLLEQRGRRRVVADVIERLDFRVSLHVGLTREDENLERFRCREDLQG